MKIGVIGLGTRMEHLLKCVQNYAPEMSVCGVVDPDEPGSRTRLPESDRDHARYFPTMSELVSRTRPDALAIGTRCNLHARLAIEAAAFGLPLFLEKPVATTLDDAIQLEDAFCGADIPVLVSFPLRASPLFCKVHSMIEAGFVGRPLHLMGWNYVPYGDVYFNSWYRDFDVTQGLFLQKATHDFDYLRLLAGSPIVKVAAIQSKNGVYRDAMFSDEADPLIHYRESIGTPETGMNEDSSSALLEFANGAHALYTQVFYARNDAQARGARICGMAGTVEFDWYRNEIKKFSHLEQSTETDRPEEAEAHFGGDGVLARNFIAMIRGQATSISPLEAGLESVYACLAAKKSAESGTMVTVRQLKREQLVPSLPATAPILESAVG